MCISIYRNMIVDSDSDSDSMIVSINYTSEIGWWLNDSDRW